MRERSSYNEFGEFQSFGSYAPPEKTGAFRAFLNRLGSLLGTDRREREVRYEKRQQEFMESQRRQGDMFPLSGPGRFDDE